MTWMPDHGPLGRVLNAKLSPWHHKSKICTILMLSAILNGCLLLTMCGMSHHLVWICSKRLCALVCIVLLQERGLYSISMPNKFNFGFQYHIFGQVSLRAISHMSTCMLRIYSISEVGFSSACINCHPHEMRSDNHETDYLALFSNAFDCCWCMTNMP